MNDFWASRIAAATPEPAMPRADGAAYRAERRAVTASRVYSKEYQRAINGDHHQAPQPSRYVDASKPLDSYQRAEQVSPYAWDESRQSPAGYLAKLQSSGLIYAGGEFKIDNMALLSDTDREAIARSVARIEQAQQTHDGLRGIIDRHGQANGVQQQGMHVEANQRFGHSREIEKNGHLTPFSISGVNLASRVEIAARLKEAEQARMEAPQRQDVSGLRPSGDGLIVTGA